MNNNNNDDGGEDTDDEEVVEEEQIAAVDNAVEGVRHCLLVCGLLTPAEQDAILLEGYVDILSFAELREKDIHEMVKSINAAAIAPQRGQGRRAAVAGPAVKITRRSARRLGGLVHWVKDMNRRGITIDPLTFTVEALIDALQEVEGEELADSVGDIRELR
jgi:hypothetical protein